MGSCYLSLLVGTLCGSVVAVITPVIIWVYKLPPSYGYLGLFLAYIVSIIAMLLTFKWTRNF